jgi:hypothetical protein
MMGFIAFQPHESKWSLTLLNASLLLLKSLFFKNLILPYDEEPYDDSVGEKESLKGLITIRFIKFQI